MNASVTQPMPSWQQQLYDRLVQAFTQDHLAHGLLVTGIAGLDAKKAVVHRFTQLLLCQQSEGRTTPCGQCPSCHWFEQGSHPDYLHVSIAEKKTQITVDQIRELAQKLTLAANHGERRVAVIEPADKMNTNAANALLKTLEEPQPGRILILITDAPWRLPITVRSRCQNHTMTLPDQATLVQDIATQTGMSEQSIQEGLAYTAHDLALIQQHLNNGGAFGKQVHQDLIDLSRGVKSFTQTAKQWAKNEPAQSVTHMVLWLRQRIVHAAQQHSEGKLSRTACQARIAGMTQLSQQCHHTLNLLTTPLRTELLLIELLGQFEALSNRLRVVK